MIFITLLLIAPHSSGGEVMKEVPGTEVWRKWVCCAQRLQVFSCLINIEKGMAGMAGMTAAVRSRMSCLC